MSRQHGAAGRPLQRVSSLILNASPNPSSSPSKARGAASNINARPAANLLQRKLSRDTSEYIPDSEEEDLVVAPKFATGSSPARKQVNMAGVEVIEISSDSDEAVPKQTQARSRESEPEDDDPFISRVPGAWVSGERLQVASRPAASDSEEQEEEIPVQTPARKGKLPSRARRVIFTSSEEETEPDEPPPPSKNKGRGVARPTTLVEQEQHIPLYEDDDDKPWNVDDGSVLTYEASKKPVKKKGLPPRLPSKPRKSIDDIPGELTFTSDPDPVPDHTMETPPRVRPRQQKTPAQSAPALRHTKSDEAASVSSDSSDDEDVFEPPPASKTPGRPATTTPRPSTKTAGRHTGRTPATPAVRATAPKRMSKKAQKEADRQHREAYAQALFIELNASVFRGGLPSDTPLIWNARMTATAGRASWRRDRYGEETSKIELASKILDSDQRINNTLAHEMCHLACWIIDREPGESHGDIWWGWVRRVERAREDIEINTRHSYEITYPYKWECEKCAEIYGRFSNSIKTEEYRCGSCREGQLIPLFATRGPRTPRTIAHSRNAALHPQGSPLSVARGSPAGNNVYPEGSHVRPRGLATKEGSLLDALSSVSVSPKISISPKTKRKTKTGTLDDIDVEKLTRTMAVIEISD